jgi:ferredoxin
MAITRVWIEEGCTMCGLCSDTCPEVFELDEDADTAKVINGADLAANEDAIKEAAGDCPEEVIKFEES